MRKNLNLSFQLCAFADEADSVFDNQLIALHENQINLIEVRGVDGKNISELSFDEASEVRKKLDFAEIKAWSIGSPIGKIHLEDDFEKHLDLFKKLLEISQILGAESFRLFSFYGSDGSNGAREKVFERLSRFCAVNEGSGIVLCHENEKGIFGETDDACLEIHKAFSTIKAVFDPANFIQAGVNPLSAWDKLSPYIAYMHVKDALSGGQIVPAGKGDANIQELLSRYESIGGGVLSVEPHLAEFVGLNRLEQGNKLSHIESYGTQREAFNSAVKALKSLLI